MYKCKCGREFEKRQSYVSHCGHCKVHLGRDPIDRFGDSRTKMTDKRIKFLKRFSEGGRSKIRKLIEEGNIEYLDKVRKSRSAAMINQLRDFEFVYKKYISSYKYINEFKKSYVYLVSYGDNIKVGFTCNLGYRLKELGYPWLVQTIEFPDVRSGLKFEFDFHKLNKSKMIWNEHYPSTYLKIFESYFVTYKQFMI